jgi:hypothetical protein
MDSHVRNLLFEPLRTNTLSAIVPDFTFESGDQEISAPAHVVRDDDEFRFTLHFNSGSPPPELQTAGGGFFGTPDQHSARGQVNGQISFRCDDVFPPTTMTPRSTGTSITVLNSHRMHLVAEGNDILTANEVGKLIGKPPKYSTASGVPFTAHLIYHGPKLKIRNSGTNISTKNDFLGEATIPTADTHQFKSETWEGALIHRGRNSTCI